jgi:histidine triad (HIT) family protein
MSYDQKNIFAHILRGDLPCIKVYEDETTLAFMDIMPQTNGHTLVISKEPAETLFDLSDEAAADLLVKVKLVSKAVKAGMQADGISIFQLNGAAAGQTVPHIHFHVMPGSILRADQPHAKVSAESAQLEINAEKIRAALVNIQSHGKG